MSLRSGSQIRFWEFPVSSLTKTADDPRVGGGLAQLVLVRIRSIPIACLASTTFSGVLPHQKMLLAGVCRFLSSTIVWARGALQRRARWITATPLSTATCRCAACPHPRASTMLFFRYDLQDSSSNTMSMLFGVASHARSIAIDRECDATRMKVLR